MIIVSYADEDMLDPVMGSGSTIEKAWDSLDRVWRDADIDISLPSPEKCTWYEVDQSNLIYVVEKTYIKVTRTKVKKITPVVQPPKKKKGSR